MTNGAPYVGIFVYEITYMPATTFLALPDPTRHAIMALRAGHGSHWVGRRWGGATVGCSMPVCRGDPRPGSAIRWQWTKDAADFSLTGEYCCPPA